MGLCIAKIVTQRQLARSFMLGTPGVMEWRDV